ncbi:hypothetical protein PI124_g11820 [Phytophthora idaei]|nr:hypothetical protein PI125_g11153 [Phytophthora idaei]KAG3151828.1 hypothetical protein PI126_g10811 [Phytophthora idaei]KAG3243353.1 hypothetical protein PI124_g11820 [Phytophthora idaei]
MFDSTQHLQALLSASSPTPHAIRGVSAALAALTAIANLTNNRKAILSLLRLRLSPRFELATPSRNSFALALFIGIFRYLQRSASVQTWQKVAAGICTLWMAPTSRPAVLSLLSTNAASTLFKDFLAKYPDLKFLKPLELLVFMAAVHLTTWILAQRHKKIRPKPAATQVQGFLRKLTHTQLVFLEWSHSISRDICRISGTSAFDRVDSHFPGVSSVRGLLEAGGVAAAVSMILPGLLEDNHLIRRMLLGDVEARAFQDALKQAKADSACDTKSVAVL